MELLKWTTEVTLKVMPMMTKAVTFCLVDPLLADNLCCRMTNIEVFLSSFDKGRFLLCGSEQGWIGWYSPRDCFWTEMSTRAIKRAWKKKTNITPQHLSPSRYIKFNRLWGSFHSNRPLTLTHFRPSFPLLPMESREIFSHYVTWWMKHILNWSIVQHKCSPAIKLCMIQVLMDGQLAWVPPNSGDSLPSG